MRRPGEYLPGAAPNRIGDFDAGGSFSYCIDRVGRREGGAGLSAIGALAAQVQAQVGYLPGICLVAMLTRLKRFDTAIQRTSAARATLIGFTITGAKIVAIDLTDDPCRIAEADLAVLGR
jgi:hypothetical protein